MKPHCIHGSILSFMLEFYERRRMIIRQWPPKRTLVSVHLPPKFLPRSLGKSRSVGLPKVIPPASIGYSFLWRSSSRTEVESIRRVRLRSLRQYHPTSHRRYRQYEPASSFFPSPNPNLLPIPRSIPRQDSCPCRKHPPRHFPSSAFLGWHLGIR